MKEANRLGVLSWDSVENINMGVRAPDDSLSIEYYNAVESDTLGTKEHVRRSRRGWDPVFIPPNPFAHLLNDSVSKVRSIHEMEVASKNAGQKNSELSSRAKVPDSANIYYSRSKELEEKGDLYNAKRAMTRAIELNENSFYLRERASLSFQLKDYGDAIRDHTAAIRLDPFDKSLYYLRGRDYAFKRDYNKAIRDFKTALALYSFWVQCVPTGKDWIAPELREEWPEIYHQLGECEFSIHNYKESIWHLTRAVALFEQRLHDQCHAYVGMRNNLASSSNTVSPFYKRTRVDDYCDDLKSRTPDWVLRALYDRSFAKYELKDWRGSLEDCVKMIAIDTNYKQAYYQRALIKTDQLDTAGAIQDFGKVIILDSTAVDPYKKRAWLLHSTGAVDLACRDWSKAAELGFTEAYEFIQKYCK